MKNRICRWFPLAVLLLGVVSSSPGWSFEIFGAGARSQALSGAVGALVSDYSAVYHNPAGLVYGQESVGVGIRGAFDRTSILLMPRPKGYEPPGYDTRRNARSDSSEPGAAGSIVLGGSFAPLDKKLTLGGFAMLPFDGVAAFDTAYIDEREQFFKNELVYTRLGERIERESFGIGLAYALQSWLSMGVGLLIIPQSETTNYIYTPNPVKPESSYLNVGVKNSMQEAVVAGVRVQPMKSLNIGLAFQDEVSLSMTGQNEIIVAGSDEEEPVIQPLVAYQNYRPPRANLGIAGFTDGGTTLSFEVTWLGWSRYIDHHGESPGFDDALEWALGVEVPFSNKAFARFGGAWRPSPVPAQTGRTNYVDNDRGVFSIGGGNEIELLGQRFQVDVGIQFQWLRSKTVRKEQRKSYPSCAEAMGELCDEVPDRDGTPESIGLQTGNPGFPGYTHGGYLLSAGMDLKWLF